MNIQTLSKWIAISSVTLIATNAHANWQCYVADQGGHQWMNIAMTQDRAVKVAMSYCTTYSPDSGTCHQTTCTEK